jgi:ubiquinol-cytochrome c reductase cytochrome c1 subunit
MFYTRLLSKRKRNGNGVHKNIKRKYTSSGSGSGFGNWIILGGTAFGAVLTSLYWLDRNRASASDIQDHIFPPAYPWNHLKMWESFDHASIRRGFFVYFTIGKACHSMQYVHYRQLVNVALSESEAKTIASEEKYHDAPNDEGDVNMRPGIADPLPNPYRNEQEARYMNNGALPPDLSLIVKAREHNEDYIFALLTGYRDPPEGFVLAENMYFNPYFPGCQISMPPPLTEGAVEYDDGTEASISQMSKDVVTYLTWASNPEQDERHLMGIKAMATMFALFLPLLYYKNYLFSMIKNRKIAFIRRTDEYKKKIRKQY